MTADEYRAALAELGLSQLAAGRWLGVCRRTAQYFAKGGPPPCAARAIKTLLILPPEWRAAALADEPQ